MNSKLLLLLIIFSFNFYKTYSENPSPLIWQQCYGGSEDEEFRSMAITPDGGFIAAGYAQSSDGNLTFNYGSADYWIVKVGGDHHIQWQKNYGGSDSDWARSVICTKDGGYVVIGYSKSTDGMVTHNHGDFDFWILKLDYNGNVIWQKSFGGSGVDNPYSILETSEGDFVVAGFTESADGDIAYNHGGQDYWVMKIDGDGNLLWEKTFGGSSNEQAACLIESGDDDYVIAGYASSADGDITDEKGKKDFWVVKIDGEGNKLWANSYGGGKEDAARWMTQMQDGSYLVTGFTASTGQDVTGHHGEQDYWVIKIDTGGALLWQKCYGGSEDDYPYYLNQCSDGSFIIGGCSESSDGDISVHHGSNDAWVIKIDSAGNLLWQNSFGGSEFEECRVAASTEDGNLLMAGFTTSDEGDISGNHGATDGWIGMSCLPLEAVISEGTVVKFCHASEVTLNTKPLPGISYQWITNGELVPGATGSAYVYSENKDASITLSVSNGACMSTSAPTTLIRHPAFSSTIHVQGNAELCHQEKVMLQAVEGSGFSFAWMRNNIPLHGATNRYYIASLPGSYKLRLTDETTGCSDNSSPLSVMSSCKRNTPDDARLSISPNPNNGCFDLTTDGLFEGTAEVTLNLYDLTGKNIWSKEWVTAEQESTLKINLPQDIINGVYLLVIKGAGFQQQSQVIVSK